MLVCIWGGGDVDFGGKADCGLNNGMGLVLMLGAMAGNGFVDVVASFKIVVRT
jgi:hypothetical protein